MRKIKSGILIACAFLGSLTALGGNHAFEGNHRTQDVKITVMGGNH